MPFFFSMKRHPRAKPKPKPVQYMKHKKGEERENRNEWSGIIKEHFTDLYAPPDAFTRKEMEAQMQQLMMMMMITMMFYDPGGGDVDADEYDKSGNDDDGDGDDCNDGNEGR